MQTSLTKPALKNKGSARVARHRATPQKAFIKSQFNAETLEAFEEAEQISRDPNAKSYTDVDEMMREILADV